MTANCTVTRSASFGYNAACTRHTALFDERLFRPRFICTVFFGVTNFPAKYASMSSTTHGVKHCYRPGSRRPAVGLRVCSSAKLSAIGSLCLSKWPYSLPCYLKSVRKIRKFFPVLTCGVFYASTVMIKCWATYCSRRRANCTPTPLRSSPGLIRWVCDGALALVSSPSQLVSNEAPLYRLFYGEISEHQYSWRMSMTGVVKLWKLIEESCPNWAVSGVTYGTDFMGRPFTFHCCPDTIGIQHSLR